MIANKYRLLRFLSYTFSFMKAFTGQNRHLQTVNNDLVISLLR